MRLIPFLTLVGCLTVPTSPRTDLPTGPGRRVLFIGNSLTYTNNLPAALADLARIAGDTFQVRSVAFPDFALEDHWNEGSALKALRASPWDVVLLQQGPSSLAENQASLSRWAGQFAPVIRSAGATPAMLMVWPSSTRAGDFAGVLAAYRNAAAAVNGLFIPAGEAWRIGLSRDAGLPVYGADGFHPSPVGTMLAALVIHERLTGRDARTLPLPANYLGISTQLWPTLQSLAHEAASSAK